MWRELCCYSSAVIYSQLTFDVRLLYGNFGYVPFVAARSIDGAGVGVAEIDQLLLDVGGQRLDASTVRHDDLRPHSDVVRVFAVDVDVRQYQRRTHTVDVRWLAR